MDRRPNPVVSVIVPARNEEACLGSCLESLVAQTGIDLEIIVVDDASTDRTAEIARSFVSRDLMTIDATSKDTTLRQAQGELSSRAENHGNTINGAVSRALPEREAPHGADARSSTVHVGADALVRPDIQVIPAPPLPDSWTGKNNAMSAGAKVAKGKWLLFTDADTVHKPESLARAVAEAEQHDAALLSYSPEQELRGFWEKAFMPVIFAELAVSYPPQAVNDPTSPIAAANGQYLLISREAYDAVGGHTAIANNLLEDVAMARLVKSSGRKIFFRYGGDAVRTRMYRSFAQMKEGWTKNLALLFPSPRGLASLRSAEFVLIIGNLAATVWALLAGRPHVALQASLLTLIVAGWFWMRIRKAHFPVLSNVVALLGLPVFSYFLSSSARLHAQSRVTWKGRRYEESSGNAVHIVRTRSSESQGSNLDMATTVRRRT